MTRTSPFLGMLALETTGIALFFVNSIGLLEFSGLLIVAISMMILPPTTVLLKGDSSGIGSSGAFLLTIMPIALLNYVYSIRFGVPVGLGDTHVHMLQYTEILSGQSRIDFADTQGLSFNFVGLYVLYGFVEIAGNMGIHQMACIIPPLMNLGVVTLVYVIVRRVHSHRIALLSMLFFGLENQVLIFGQEMRTQTLGTLLIFCALAITVMMVKLNRNRMLHCKIALITLIFAIPIASFVSFILAIVIFVPLLVVPSIINQTVKWPNSVTIVDSKLVLLLITFFAFYLVYLSKGLEYIMPVVISLIEDMLAKTGNPTFSTGHAAYGVFVQLAAYGMWIVFGVAALLFLRRTIRNRDSAELSIAVSLSGILVFAVINSMIGVLSAGRVYAVAFILISTVISFTLIRIHDSTQMSKRKLLRTAIPCMVVLVFALSSVAKMPQYVVGETQPLRSEEPIDSVTWWSPDYPQYAVAAYVQETVYCVPISVQIIFPNYNMLHAITSNQLTVVDDVASDDDSGNGMETLANLIILHDKFNGGNYTFRETYLDSGAYSGLSSIYANGDYAIYLCC